VEIAGVIALVVVVTAVGVVLIGAGVRLKLRRRAPVPSEVFLDAGVALLTGAVVGFVLTLAADGLEERRVERSERLEAERVAGEERRDNVRWVREVASQPELDTERPELVTSKQFAGLDLAHAAFPDWT
jgi:hypothetical protein